MNQAHPKSNVKNLWCVQNVNEYIHIIDNIIIDKEQPSMPLEKAHLLLAPLEMHLSTPQVRKKGHPLL
jgi:hypothetical protein